ncbi:hypothetical protein KY289_023081 [Solanum tuberosum]|nr:hypothetical protein KY289_023081 [Solanum tuberosum]
MASARMTQLFQDVRKTLPQKSMKSHKVRRGLNVYNASSSNGQSSQDDNQAYGEDESGDDSDSVNDSGFAHDSDSVNESED